MVDRFTNLDALITHARSHGPIRLAVVAAQQRSVLSSIVEAASLNLVTPFLIGDPSAIRDCAHDIGLAIDTVTIIPAKSQPEAARLGVDLIRDGGADAIMKGHIHTDVLMRALLNSDVGLRVPGKRVSHIFIIDIPTYPKLLAVTDAAINIAPDLMAKAQILENAVELLQLLSITKPKVAVLSAVETVMPAITSTLDAAALSMMAKRGQISNANVDGPLAFDNAISIDAAEAKGIVSEVAGDADILLVPDLVSGNILAKNLTHFTDATAAGIVIGLSVPVALSSRSDPPSARLAALALAVLSHHRAGPNELRLSPPERLGSTIHCAAQPDAKCCPIEA